MATTLGGTTIPTPVTYPDSADDSIVQRRMANGTLRTTVIANNRKWLLSWAGMSSANVTTLRGRYTVGGTMAFVNEDSETYTVAVTANTWQCTPVPLAAGRRWDVTFGLTEV